MKIGKVTIGVTLANQEPAMVGQLKKVTTGVQLAGAVEMTVEEMTPEEYELWKLQHLEETNNESK